MTVPAGTPLCLDCGKTATTDQSCDGGDPDAGSGRRHHYVGADHPLGCSWCGRLKEVCRVSPCSPEGQD